MKVFHLINTLSAGGAELHLLTLCRRQLRMGLRVVVGCLREQVSGSRSLVPDFEGDGIPVIRFPGEGRWDPRFLPLLTSRLREEVPDILHSHLPRADLAAALVRRRAGRMAWITSVHDIYSRSWSGRWALPLVDRMWRQADAVIAISAGVQEWLVADRRLPAERVSVIRYGIEPGRFAAPGFDLRSAWDLHRAFIVGAVGRLEPRKGHDILIKAIPAVLQQVPTAVLLIAGHDPWRYGPVLQRLINRLGLAHHVRLVGFVADMASFFQAIDILAFASRSEGFGQVLIEGMDSGRPVVASQIAPLTEIVDDQVTGLLAPAGDSQAFAEAITFLATRPAQRAAMGKRGQERVQAYFTAERMAGETERLYHAVLGHRG